MKSNAKHLKNVKEENFLTTEEASKELGIKPSVIRNYLYFNKLTTYKFKTLTLLHRSEIEAWKKRQGKRGSVLI